MGDFEMDLEVESIGFVEGVMWGWRREVLGIVFRFLVGVSG